MEQPIYTGRHYMSICRISLSKEDNSCCLWILWIFYIFKRL